MRTQFYAALMMALCICELQNRIAFAIKLEGVDIFKNMFANQYTLATIDAESTNEKDAFTKGKAAFEAEM